jgi:hypothetical protein
MESPLRLLPLECTQAHSHHEQNKIQTVTVNLTHCDCLYPCPFHITSLFHGYYPPPIVQTQIPRWILHMECYRRTSEKVTSRSKEIIDWYSVHRRHITVKFTRHLHRPLNSIVSARLRVRCDQQSGICYPWLEQLRKHMQTEVWWFYSVSIQVLNYKIWRAMAKLIKEYMG